MRNIHNFRDINQLLLETVLIVLTYPKKGHSCSFCLYEGNLTNGKIGFTCPCKDIPNFVQEMNKLIHNAEYLVTNRAEQE